MDKKVEWGDAWRQLDDAHRRVQELEAALKRANATNSRLCQKLYEIEKARGDR